MADVVKHVAAILNVKYRCAGLPVYCSFEIFRLEETVVHRTSFAGPFSLALRRYMDTTPGVASPRPPRRVERFERIDDGRWLDGRHPTGFAVDDRLLYVTNETTGATNV